MGSPDLSVTRQLVETHEEAERVAGARVGLTCRPYSTPDGYAGAPTLEKLREMLIDPVASTSSKVDEREPGAAS
ncbi:MAG: hypothetical protein WB473_09210 [Pedococcus sp.]